VKQHLRCFEEEKRRAIGEEVHKLMAAGFIKEVFHPEWLANPVLVKKKGGKWRMCVDYTGLNKACPKVPYPLSRIHQIVDSTAGCETLSFIDAYKGYHPDKGVGLGDLPHGNSCRLGPPLEGTSCGGQPTGMVRRSTGCRGQPRLKGLPGGQTSQALPPLAERKREGKIKTHRGKTKTEVSSDTYPLWTKANRACGEAPRASVPVGAAEGCPAADSGAASAPGAQGTEGEACPGVVTTTGGSTSCTAGTSACSWGTVGSARLPGATSITLAKGSSTPSACLRSSDWDLDALAPDIDGTSPLGGWLGDP
jgi:hypothetical protein